MEETFTVKAEKCKWGLSEWCFFILLLYFFYSALLYL